MAKIIVLIIIFNKYSFSLSPENNKLQNAIDTALNI